MHVEYRYLDAETRAELAGAAAFRFSVSAGIGRLSGRNPDLSLSLIGGVVADRVERRNLLLMSQVIQMSCAFTLTLLFAFHLVHVWHILALSFVVGLAQSFGGPAYSALIPTLVDTEDLPNAIALNSIQFNLARVIGPMLGGLALANWGATWCFGLNGISFVAVIISLLIVRSRFVPQKTGESVLASMRQGIAFVRGQGAMTGLIALSFTLTLLAIPLIVFLPVFARDVLHGNASTFTILLCCSGAGSVVGALIVAGFGQLQRRGRVTLTMMVALGILIAGFSLSKTLWVSAMMVFFSGAAMISVFAMISSLVQLITPDQMRGRVMSVYNVAFRGGMPIGSLVIGALVPKFTAPVVLSCNGILLSLVAIYFLAIQRRVATL